MLCEKCQQNQAVVHTQIYINGTKKEMHLCQECSMQIDMPINFENLFHGFLDSLLSMSATNKQNNQKPEKSIVKCPTCGMTHEGFKASGKLGCVDCYRTFARELEAVLKNVQGSTRHEGKFPRKSGLVLFQKREVDKLRQQLIKAIENENFEEAAQLRDRIRAMEVEL